MEPERRATTPRRRTLKEGKVVLSDWTVLDCIIRNLTDTGARLEFGGPTELPENFRLLIVSSNLLVPTRVAWCRGSSAGVNFTGPGSEAPLRKLRPRADSGPAAA